MWTPRGKSGDPGEINARGELFTFSNRRPEEAVLNDAGRLFVAKVSNTPGGAGNAFCALTNTGTRDLHVFRAYVTTASAETITLYLGANRTLTGSTAVAMGAVTFGSLNSGKNFNPSVTFGTGTNITGYDANALEVDLFKINANNQEILRNYDGRIVLTANTVLYARATTGSVAAVLYFVFGYPFTVKETA